MAKKAETERERQERALAALTERADILSLEIKATETKYHRAEARVGGTCGRQLRRDKQETMRKFSSSGTRMYPLVCSRLYRASVLEYCTVKQLSLVLRVYHKKYSRTCTLSDRSENILVRR